MIGMTNTINGPLNLHQQIQCSYIILFSKTASHVFPAVSKQGYTDHYLVA